jgi:alkylated DNA repair dioxygenase AlkB
MSKQHLSWSEMESVHYRDPLNGLDVTVHKSFLSSEEENDLFNTIKALPWYRVKYESDRHKNQCETPCWTNMFGGFPELKPYQKIPSCLQDICDKVSSHTGASYNAILVRLYFDGSDNIAWHTDGRTFLGNEPNIASLSLGSRCQFQLRKMTNVWPTTQTPNGGVDKTVPQVNITVAGGDLMVMRGRTQQEWHHRVPKEPCRGPRININFRQILPDRTEVALRGVQAFYKYMVSGDSKTENWDITAPTFTYEDIVKRQGPLMAFFKKSGSSVPVTSSSVVVSSDDGSSRGVGTKRPVGDLSSSEEEEKMCAITPCQPIHPAESKDVKRVRSDPTQDVMPVSTSWECEMCTFINNRNPLSPTTTTASSSNRGYSHTSSMPVCEMCGHLSSDVGIGFVARSPKITSFFKRN